LQENHQLSGFEAMLAAESRIKAQTLIPVIYIVQAFFAIVSSL
jgi:hypothetical protein